jgi:hypothetical protein
MPMHLAVTMSPTLTTSSVVDAEVGEFADVDQAVFLAREDFTKAPKFVVLTTLP